MGLGIILIAIVVIVIIWSMYRNESPLDKLPGPPRYPIVGCFSEFLRITPRNLFLRVRNYTKQYGDRFVIRIFNRRILHLFSVQDVEAVLSHSKNIKKSLPYSFLQPWLGNGLFLSDGPQWHRRRKILTPTFHFNILKNFTLVFEEKSRALVQKLNQMEGTYVDVFPVISDNTLFAICETAMGTRLDADDSSDVATYIQAVLEINTLFLSRLMRIWLHSNFVFWRHPIGKKFKYYLDTSRSFTDKVIAQKKRNWTPKFSEDALEGKRRLVMLDLLLEAESKGDIDLEGIREEVDTIMAAGYDTTTMALVFGLMLIANDEEVQDRIYEECKSVLSEPDCALTMSNLADMKYLEAVIKEILRLYPSAPFIGRELVEDIMLDGLLVPKGTEVAVLIYDLHRRPDVYSDPESFKPDRFLTGEPIHPYAFVPFSAGPRNCLGQKFAMLEMKCVISSICRNFKLSPREPGERPELIADILIRPSAPVFVKFIPRN